MTIASDLLQVGLDAVVPTNNFTLRAPFDGSLRISNGNAGTTTDVFKVDSSGNITVATWAGTTIPTTKGGTGLTAFTSGGAVYATSTSALSTGTLPVTAGGTGAATLTSNAVLVGNGTGAVQAIAPGASGNVLTSNGTTWASSTPGASGATLSDDTTTNTTQYIGMARATTGAWTSAYVASTKLYFNPSTGVLNATIFNSLSDANFKENIQTISDSTNIVNQLRGVSFDWKENGEKSFGVIAQELETIIPELVSSETVDGVEKKSVNYSGIIAFLINAIQEMDKRIKELEVK